jgi:hypothetical protein
MASGLKLEQGMSREITGDITGKKLQGTGNLITAPYHLAASHTAL